MSSFNIHVRPTPNALILPGGECCTTGGSIYRTDNYYIALSGDTKTGSTYSLQGNVPADAAYIQQIYFVGLDVKTGGSGTVANFSIKGTGSTDTALNLSGILTVANLQNSNGFVLNAPNTPQTTTKSPYPIYSYISTPSAALQGGPVALPVTTGTTYPLYNIQATFGGDQVTSGKFKLQIVWILKRAY